MAFANYEATFQVEATQFTGAGDLREIIQRLRFVTVDYTDAQNPVLTIEDAVRPASRQKVHLGDWIVIEEGTASVFTNDEFIATYTEVA